MMRLLLTLVALTCALVFPSTTWAAPTRKVDVRVVDIAGARAFLSAGSGKGLRVGTRVRFGQVEHRVEKTTLSFAVVSARKLRVGARGIALVTSQDEVPSARLPDPRPLSAFQNMWPEAERPAEKQTPRRYIPLGGRVQKDAERIEATLTASGLAAIPLEGDAGALGRGELRGRLHAVPVANWPMALEADIAVQQWFGRYTTGIANGDPRPWWRVRQLELVFGHTGGYRAELGRLRYAAVNVGPMDGARVEAARWGPVRVAGFGGILPDPIDNTFATGAGRFGLEVDLMGEELSWRPQLTVVLQGSVFEGRLDERRIYAQGRVWPKDHRLGGYVEASAFDKDNPWGRPAAEITAGGADVDFRFSEVRLGARFDMRKPERSYWLQNSLPLTWLCSSSSSLAMDPSCSGTDDTRYMVQGFGGWDHNWVQVDVGGAFTTSSEADLGKHAIGHGTLRFPRVADRFDLALGGSQEGGSLLRSQTTLRADFGMGFREERVRLNLYYRPAHRRYEASISGLWEQGAGASLRLAPVPLFALDILGDVRFGDLDAALIMVNAMYRFAD